MEKELSCEDRVAKALESRLDDLRQLWKAEIHGTGPVEDLGILSEYYLSFDYVAAGTFGDQPEGYFRFQISWGGPSDEFRYYTDPQFNVSRIEYWFLDWFDGASITLKGADSCLLEDIFINYFAELGQVENEYRKALD